MQNENLTTKKMSEKGVAWILFAAYCVLLFIVYAKYYFADCLPMSGDAINWITDITLLKNALASGEFPFWNKFLIGGIPFAPSLTPIMLLGFLPIKGMITSY